jgi:putative ATPase
VALGLAQRDVREGPRGDVPGHLRDAHYRSAATIGHGEGYVYPHDQPDAFVDQQYRPTELTGNRYYEPSDRGHEAVVGERLRRWRHQGFPDGAPPEANEDHPPTGSSGVPSSGQP